MPKLVKPLNDTKIKNAKTITKDLNMYDGGGLLLLVKSNGSKIWRFRYESPITKKRTTISFGSYPSVSLTEARKLRKSALQLLAMGTDPQQNKKEIEEQKKAKYTNTLRYIAIDWFRTESNRDISTETLIRKWRSLENHVFYSLGDLPISSITAKQFIDAVNHLSERGNLDMLGRVIQRINQLMIYAKNFGFIKENTAENILSVFNNPKVEHMPTISPIELPEFMSELNKAQVTYQTKCLIEFQLLTMTRPIETARCEWSEIDFNGQLWVIPASKMKTKKEHIIPLSQPAIDILKDMQRFKRNDDAKYVFTELKSPYVKHMSSETANNAIKNKVKGFKGRLVAHGMRAIASCAMNDCGFNYKAIEISLSHLDSNKVAGAYNHKALLLKQRKIMMDWWGDVVKEAKQQRSEKYNTTLLNQNKISGSFES